MAAGLHRASRLAGRLVALGAVVHSVVIVLLAGVGLGMEPVAAPDPTLALLAAIAHVIAFGLVVVALESSEFFGTSLLVAYADALAALTCMATAGLLWLAGSATWLTLPCVLLAALVSAAHAAGVLLMGVTTIQDDISWSLRLPAELAPGAKVKVLSENCCCREWRYGVLLRKVDADDTKKLSNPDHRGNVWFHRFLAAGATSILTPPTSDEWWVQIGKDSLRVPTKSLFARDESGLCVGNQTRRACAYLPACLFVWLPACALAACLSMCRGSLCHTQNTMTATK